MADAGRPNAAVGPGQGAGAGVAVVADDLIWSSRLAEAVRRAGALPLRLGTEVELDTVLGALELEEPGGPGGTGAGGQAPLVGAIVDLLGHRFDGVAAVRRFHAARLPVIAVAQHDDQVTRRRALDAGAGRVFSYAKFHADGPRLVAGWLVAAGVPAAAGGSGEGAA